MRGNAEDYLDVNFIIDVVDRVASRAIEGTKEAPHHTLFCQNLKIHNFVFHIHTKKIRI